MVLFIWFRLSDPVPSVLNCEALRTLGLEVLSEIIRAFINLHSPSQIPGYSTDTMYKGVSETASFE